MEDRKNITFYKAKKTSVVAATDQTLHIYMDGVLAIGYAKASAKFQRSITKRVTHIIKGVLKLWMSNATIS